MYFFINYHLAMNKTIKILRNKYNYSQSSVAEYLGISRQMYIKYETGAAELSVKTIKSLANLYKISSDIILEDKLSDSNDLYFAKGKKLEVAEPKPEYGVSNLNKVLQLLPKLVLSEQISVMAKLASLMQEQSIESVPVLPQKNKKIPDAEYIKLMHLENEKTTNSYSHIREVLKNDEW